MGLRKILIITITIFLIGSISAYFLMPFLREKIEKKVLSLLEERLEFCNIIKSEINLFGNSKFWLICNGRPFYTEYKNGNLSYELNGWGWLKSTEYWEELKECVFYKPKSDNLYFVCPKDLQEPIRIKIFKWDNSTFLLKKIEEKEFSTVLLDDLSQAYPFIKNCSLTTFSVLREREEKPFLIEMNCDGIKTLVSIFPGLNYISIPYFEVGNKEESIKYSFEKIFGEKCEEFFVFDTTLYAKCLGSKLEVNYYFEPFYYSQYKFSSGNDIRKTETEFINNFLKYFLLNFDEEKKIHYKFRTRIGVNTCDVYDNGIIFIIEDNKIVGAIKYVESY